MNCDNVRDRLTQYLLGDLDAPERAGIETHLEKCEGCRASARDLQPTLDVLRDALAATAPAGERLSPAHRARVRRASAHRSRRVAWWVAQGHPKLVAAAALVVIGAFLIGMMLPALSMSRGRACAYRVPKGSGAPAVSVARAVRIDREMKRQLEAGGLGEDADADGLGDSYETSTEEAPEKLRMGTAREAAGPPDSQGWALTSAGRDGGPAVRPGYAGASEVPPSAGPVGGEPEQPEGLGYGRVAEVGKEFNGAVSGYPSAPDGSSMVKKKRMAGKMGAGAGIERGFIAGGVATETTLDAEGEREAPADGHKPSPAPPPQKAEPRPAEIDSVTIVKSPIIMKGIYGARSPGTRGGRVTADYGAAPKEEAQPAAGPAPAAKPAAPERFDEAARLEDRRKADNGEIAEARGEEDSRERRESDRGAFSRIPAAALPPPSPERPGADRPESGRAWPARHQRLNEELADLAENMEKKEKESEESLRRPLGIAAAPPPVAMAGAKMGVGGGGRPAEDARTGPRFKAVGVNPFHSAAERPFSTFSIDVDTAAYTLARNYMLRGFLPPAEAVRTEEFVNFFDYAYDPPERGLFRIYAEWAPSKFGRGLYLLKIGVKGRRLGREEQRAAALTFLVDTSGSMAKPDRLELAQRSLRLLVERLAPVDRVAIVQFDSHARLVLEHTPASDRAKIAAAIDGLQCSGSTNLEEGMRRAYEVAAAAFAAGGENRVLLLSDGVANLGTGAAADILARVERYRAQGVFLSVFGLGMGTYDDEMLETLANKGNGTYAFIDSDEEARRVFVDDLAATLNTIAADAKIQVEFNPERVAQYRQLGYENRQLKKEDFRDDKVDAGEVGSGQSVTALYEVEMAAGGETHPGAAGAAPPLRGGDLGRGETHPGAADAAPPLRGGNLGRGETHPGAAGAAPPLQGGDFRVSGGGDRAIPAWQGSPPKAGGAGGAAPIAVVRVRYRRTADGAVEEIERPVTEADRVARFDAAGARFRLAAGVAEFAEILRASPFAAGSGFEDVAAVLRPVALELDMDGRVAELLRMAEAAGGMSRGE